MTNLLTKPALELAALVKAGEVTATELTEAALAAIDARDGEVNAFVATDPERALAAAAEIEAGDGRPFAGVPLAIKDLSPVAGLPLTFGSQLLDDFTPQADGLVATRLKNAGCVVVGMTNMPELGVLPVTEPRRYGPSRNPWDLGRTPGGSSGGSAAAVAAGMVPLAHASDGGGSTRIPAACCGLVGLKPARGRISVAPRAGDSLLTSDGVVTRTVADTAATLDVLSGYVAGDSTWAPPPSEPFAVAATRDPGALRVALTLAPPLAAPVDPVAERAARDAAELLESLGHTVEEVTEPEWSRDAGNLLKVFSPVFGMALTAAITAGARLTGNEPGPHNMEGLSLAIYERARTTTAIDYANAVAALQAVGRRVVEWTTTYDAILTPALAGRPVPIGDMPTDIEDPWQTFRRSGRMTPFTAIGNVTGLPAIALPLFHGDDGLPLAIQLFGSPAGEERLLALSAQLEAVRPWADRIAPLAT